MGMLDRLGDSFIARSAQERAERMLYHVGRLPEALALDQAEYRRLVERGQIGLLPPIVQSMSVLEQLLGDWPAARRHAREVEDLVEQGEEIWRERAEMARGRILAWDGDLDAARTIGIAALAREEASGDAWEAAIFCALLGFIELSVPDPAAALGHLLRANAYADQLRVALPTVFRYLGDLVEAAVLAGELELAEVTLVDRLESPAERIPLPWIVLVSARGRGHLAVARGEPDEAVQWFDRSLEVLETTPMPFERGRSLLGRGQAHLRAGRRRLARADLDEARSIFAELGAEAWTNRAEAELARIGGRGSSRWELTPSEQSVAELAALGRSNREIADRLVISVRTVESHLASAYRKLNVKSRVQLSLALAGSTDEGPLPG
jgi:DNA-binding CsgD family transcriptional regulator